MTVHKTEKEWDMDMHIDTLAEADRIRADASLMSEIEQYLKDKVINLASVETQLFGSDHESEHEDEKPEKVKIG